MRVKLWVQNLPCESKKRITVKSWVQNPASVCNLLIKRIIKMFMFLLQSLITFTTCFAYSINKLIVYILAQQDEYNTIQFANTKDHTM